MFLFTIFVIIKLKFGINTFKTLIFLSDKIFINTEEINTTLSFNDTKT